MCAQDNGPLNGLQKSFIKYASVYRELNCGMPDLNERMMAIIDSFGPDILFIQVQAQNVIMFDVICQIKARYPQIRIYNFTGDVRHPIPSWYKELAPLMTSTLFTNMTDVETMMSESFSSNFLELGFDPEIYHPSGVVNRVSDIIFMGNNYGANYFPLSIERIRTMDVMTNHFGDKFGYYGSGWPFSYGSLNHSQPEEAAVYRGAKIAINLSHFECKQYSSDRLLRILGSGVMCMCRWFPEIEKRFTHRENLVVYRDVSELVYLCEYYLEHENERAAIAEAGCKLAHSTYTFDNMIQNLIKINEQY